MMPVKCVSSLMKVPMIDIVFLLLLSGGRTLQPRLRRTKGGRNRRAGQLEILLSARNAPCLPRVGENFHCAASATRIVAETKRGSRGALQNENEWMQSGGVER